jgi:kumamolisin
MKTQRISLPGSERQPLGSRVADQPGDENIEVSVILKPKARAAVPRAHGAFLTRDEFAASHGADPAAVEAVRNFAKEYDLKVLAVFSERRTVQLEGTAANMTRAFEAKLDQYEHEGHRYRARTGAISLPPELASSVEAVLGLDNRPQAKTHFRIRSETTTGTTAHPKGGHSAKAAKAISYTPKQVASLYQFPTGVDGTGETIGILELGGGYKPADLKTYFPSEGVKQPTVVAVLVDKAKNQPTNPNGADGEVLLDIEVAGSVAPGAKIVVYFAPNTSQGFQDALTTAIHDKTNNPSVISISWGSAESTWTGQAMTAFDSAAQDAAALGVTICAAAGDNGSSDGVTDGKNHVDFPCSSPHILACGGTSLQSAGGAITSETVWNDGAQGGATGGGFSTVFPAPSYQSAAGITPPTGGGRGVPDVSGNADPETGYQVLVDGQSLVIGGTSAVAPLWSGLIALLNQKRGKPLGLLQTLIYPLPSSSKAFHDITSGSNGAFTATAGWDACTGLGSPQGTNLATALSGSGATKSPKPTT